MVFFQRDLEGIESGKQSYKDINNTLYYTRVHANGPLKSVFDGISCDI